MEPRSIPLARPVTDEREAEAARRPIVKGWLTQGPEVEAFEQEFKKAVGAGHACAVSNCTTALHLALRAVGVVAESEVITVSHSFIATASAVRYLGAIPVFADIEPTTYNLDPAKVEALITPRTRAILVVHQIGMPADLPRLVEIAQRRGLKLVEDAACAAGSEIAIDGAFERIGRPRGDIACFSFHPRKVITTGDGGMITSNDPELDRKVRLWRQHSMSVSDAVRHGSKQVVFESYDEIGFNYRMTDVQAAIGRVQLERLPEIIAARRKLAARYKELLLSRTPGVIPPFEPSWARSNWQSYCVRLPEGRDQLKVMQGLLDRGVASRRAIMCSHREKAYGPGGEAWGCGAGPGACGCPPLSCKRLLESERAQDQAILLPLYVQMSESDQDYVIEALRQSL